MTENSETIKAFYEDLPSHIKERCAEELNLPPKDLQSSTSEELKVLIESIVPEYSKNDVIKELKRDVLLGDKKTRVRPSKNRLKNQKCQEEAHGYHRGKKRMTSIEKRNLGLLTLKKRNKTFEMFVPIHKIWRKYAKELLGIKHHTLENWKADYTDKRTEIIQTRLKKIEYYGCFLKVTRSRCPSYVSVQGIVIQETKNTFTFITEENCVKMIPKLHSEFSFAVGDVGFTILGCHLHQRPIDRAKQNIKKHRLWL